VAPCKVPPYWCREPNPRPDSESWQKGIERGELTVN
jgi:hypothetical protein